MNNLNRAHLFGGERTHQPAQKAQTFSPCTTLLYNWCSGTAREKNNVSWCSAPRRARNAVANRLPLRMPFSKQDFLGSERAPQIDVVLDSQASPHAHHPPAGYMIMISRYHVYHRSHGAAPATLPFIRGFTSSTWKSISEKTCPYDLLSIGVESRVPLTGDSCV